MHPRPGLLIVCALLAPGLAGCATADSPTELVIEAGDYPHVFEAAKATLRSMRFDLERIDARAGVISTAEKSTAGLFMPWDAGWSSFRQDLEDTVQHQRRRARITFERPEAAGAPPPESDQDLREQTGLLTMRVRVVIERVQRPGWRINTTSIGLSTRAVDPALAGRDMIPEYRVAIGEDAAFSARLLRAIRQRQDQPDSFEMPGNWKAD